MDEGQGDDYSDDATRSNCAQSDSSTINSQYSLSADEHSSQVLTTDVETQVDLPEEDGLVKKVVVPRNRRRIGRREFMLMLLARQPQRRQIISAGVNRAQAYQIFYHEYIPNEGYHMHVVGLILQLAESGKSQALSRAVDAASALCIHRGSNNPSLVREASSMYSKALLHAQRELKFPMKTTSVSIATAHMLSICEFLHSTSLEDMSARSHTYWLLFLLQSSRSKANDAEMEVLVSANLMAFAVWELVISRRCPFKIPDDSKNENYGVLQNPSPALSKVGVSIARALEKSDELCRDRQGRETSLARILDSMQVLVKLEGRVHEVMTSFQKSVSRPLYKSVTVQRLAAPKVAGSDSLFGYLYEFYSAHTGVMCVTSWIYLFALIRMRIEILETYHSRVESEGLQLHPLRRLLNEYANSLCMSMPWMARPQSGWACTIMLHRPLRLLYIHYRQQKDWAKLAWCVQCAQDLGVLKAYVR